MSAFGILKIKVVYKLNTFINPYPPTTMSSSRREDSDHSSRSSRSRSSSSRSRSSSSRSRSRSLGREAHEDWRAELRYRSEHRSDRREHYDDDRSAGGDDRARHTDRNDRSKYNIIMCFRCSELGHSTDECLTFKIKLCKHYMNGWCKLDDGRTHCSYAHGEAELRKPWQKKCVRVWSKKNGDACVSGCGKVGHTYTECKLYQ